MTCMWQSFMLQNTLTHLEVIVGFGQWCDLLHWWSVEVSSRQLSFVYLFMLFVIMSVAKTVKIKVKIHPRSGHKSSEGEERYSSTLCLTSALDGVGSWCYAPAVSHAGERPGTHCVVGWVGPRVGLDGCGKSRPTAEFNPQTIQPVEHY